VEKSAAGFVSVQKKDCIVVKLIVLNF